VAGLGGGQTIIDGFRIGTDCLQISGLAVTSQTTMDGSTQIILSDNTRIQLAGVTGLESLSG
jgi:hypothetical protein